MDFGSTEAAAAKQLAVASIRARIGARIGTWVKDPECVQMAIACAMRDSSEMLDFLFSASVAKEAQKDTNGLMLTIGEWSALFGSQARPTRVTPVEALCSNYQFQTSVRAVQNALRCTVDERDIAPQWSRPVTKAACVLAMHTETHEDFLESALGSVVKADARRLDDLREALETEGTDVMMIAAAIVALAQIVT